MVFNYWLMFRHYATNNNRPSISLCFYYRSYHRSGRKLNGFIVRNRPLLALFKRIEFVLCTSNVITHFCVKLSKQRKPQTIRKKKMLRRVLSITDISKNSSYNLFCKYGARLLGVKALSRRTMRFIKKQTAGRLRVIFARK